MATGTEKVIGFIMAAQRPLNEFYLNEGVSWTDEAEVLAGIPSVSRSAGMLVNIAGVLYWFDDNLTTLSTVFSGSLPTADQVGVTDAGELYDADNVEDALAEIMAFALALEATIPDPAVTAQTVFTIDLGAYSTVAARVAGATETTDYPTDWELAASSTVNLLITHTLTGRKLAGCNVFEIDGANERLLVPFSSAYTGILCNGLTVLIEGLTPTALAIRIELLFK